MAFVVKLPPELDRQVAIAATLSGKSKAVYVADVLRQHSLTVADVLAAVGKQPE
jgi:predicted HicB family RNase H-like nuclease